MTTDSPTKPLMNTEPLEVFVTDLAMLLAGTVTNSDTAEPFTPDQLGIIFFSAVASYARTLPDYNPEQDISDIIRLGVAAYGESVYATVNAALVSSEPDVDIE